jgi:hypothetical protein
MGASNKELKELVVGVNEVSLCLISQFKDGVQVMDFVAFYEKLTSDAEFKSKVEAAYLGAQQIPAEVADLDAGEVVELVMVQAGYVPRLIDALVG